MTRKLWRLSGGSSVDRFVLRGGLSARGCSLRLQRAVVAFGLDFPYEQSVAQLEEHYGVIVSKSKVRGIRYMSNRSRQLDYLEAIQADLPIGSGLIESGHRHVLQRRLKIPGAWTMANAGNLARARIVRKNDGLDRYWQDRASPKAA